MEGFHFCQRCNRRLKSPKAIQDGMGAVCKRKSKETKVLAELEADKDTGTTDVNEHATA